MIPGGKCPSDIHMVVYQALLGNENSSGKLQAFRSLQEIVNSSHKL